MALTVNEIVLGKFKVDSDDDFHGYLGEDECQIVRGVEEDCTVGQV